MAENTPEAPQVQGVRETGSSRSIAQLTNDLSEQLSRLVRDEMRLATAELQGKAKRLGMASGALTVAGVLALVAVLAFVAAAVLGVATALPAWLAALLVGGGLLVIAGMAGLVGKVQLNRATPPTPTEAVRSTQRDLEVVKESVRR